MRFEGSNEAARSYAAAAAARSSAPARHFCVGCGRLGGAACARCGARFCGLACRNGHVAAGRCSLRAGR